MQQTIFTSLTPEQLQELISEAVRRQLDHSNNNPQTKEDPYLTREEAARILHVSYPTLRRFVVAGKVKSHRIGRKVLYKKSEINNFVS